MVKRAVTAFRVILCVSALFACVFAFSKPGKQEDFKKAETLEQVLELVKFESKDLALFDFDRVLIPVRGKSWTSKAFAQGASEVLNKIKESGATLGGLTKRMPFRLEVLDSALEELSINFDWLDGIEEKFVTGSRLRKGILFTCCWSKGQCLESIFERKAFDKSGLPKRIVFIDDSLSNLRSVRGFAKNHNIEFVGIWFCQKSQTKYRQTNYNPKKVRN